MRIITSLLVLIACAGVSNMLASDGAAPKSPAPAVPSVANTSATVRSATQTSVPLPAKNVHDGQKLTYMLVAGPKHGTLEMAPSRLENSSRPAFALYTSAKDFVGEDSFTWKVGTGAADSEPSTVTLAVTAAVPVPKIQVGYIFQDKAADIPAAYSGGGGFSYTLKTGNPAHGTLTLNGATFHYVPQPGYTGSDAFTWSMNYAKEAKDAKTAPTATPAVTCNLVVKAPGNTDWTQWRADEWRSGFTAMPLPPVLHLQWKRELSTAPGAFGGPGSWVYPDIDYCRPVQLGKTLFVPVSGSDCVAAYNTETGALRWRFYASGAVRRPPLALRLGAGSSGAAPAGGAEVVIFGSDDGWLYCLNAADGTVRWKFRGAPNNRKAMGFGRFSSVWPVWASPVASSGKIYFAAGYLPAFGLYAYCLDAASGAVVWANDGRITDMWNTSALGPLAVSFDGSRLFGTVEGAAVPWMLDSATGEYLGRMGIGHRYPGVGRGGSCGWYVDGRGTPYRLRGEAGFEAEPSSITAGSQTITAASVAALGVSGTVASLLAGDGKLFVTTAEGSLYCFAGTDAKPALLATDPPTPTGTADAWTAAAKAMLSREDLKQGLALVWGAGSGRLAEELARQSALTVVVVDPDPKKLQALRAKMDGAGFPAARLSSLEGNPLDFGFAPYQAALVTSEDLNIAGVASGQKMLEKMYACTRPFGGEIWLPTSDAQDAALAGFAAASKSMPLSAVARQKIPSGPGDGFTQLKRTGFPEEKPWMKPPFGVLAFGPPPACWRPPLKEWPRNGAYGGRDVYSWLPLKAAGPGETAPASPYAGTPGYPTPDTLSTPRSIYTSMLNPLFGLTEKFSGLPGSGNDGACVGGGPTTNRYGDYALTHGKIESFFDASANYWGRFFPPAFGHCPGYILPWNGLIHFTSGTVPGAGCGCSPFMEFTDMALAPMEDEETWVCYQCVRTSHPFEETPIKRIGINFGAPGDRFVPESGVLWTHHPFAGRCGAVSYNGDATTECLPLVPVGYRGKVASVYHHSAQMEKAGSGSHAWVAASYVKGMTEITVPLAQPAVALKTAAAPKVDGNLNDECWDGKGRLVFVANSLHAPIPGRHYVHGDDRDPQPSAFLPKLGDECFAMLRYDGTHLYVAAGVQAGYGPRGKDLFAKVTLNSRERAVPDVVLTCDAKSRQSAGIPQGAWSGAAAASENIPFTAELAIPWEALAAAGLWKEQLAINIDVAGNLLVAQYTPLYLDAPRGIVTETHPHAVRLYFAEMEGKKPSERVFDVSLQGKPALAKLDVVKEAGGPKRELVKEIKDVGISDRLVIGFAPQAGEPLLSGVEILGNYTPAANLPPSAKIEASTFTGPAPLEVLLSARGSQDPDGQIAECAWETGDGRLAKGSLLRHVFAEPGTFKVHLLVRDNRGALAAASTTVNVQPGAPAAFVSTIRAKGGDYATLSSWEAALRSDLTAGIKSLLFAVKSRGKCAPADDGTGVTFTGGGKGTLKHINAANVAYVTECSGTFQAGTVTCASGNTFEVADAGHPVCTVVAECYHEWPAGLAESVTAGAGWKTDPLHCAVIRPAAGQGARGVFKTSDGSYAGFAVKGNLDLQALPHTRIGGLVVDPGSTLSMGPGASVLRVLAGNLILREDGMAANSVATTVSVANSANVVNQSVSFYTQSARDAKPKPPNITNVVKASHVSLYNCTAATFDPGNQAEVWFVNCLAAPGGKGFRDAGYSEPGYANHCVSADGTASVWESGDNSEANAPNQALDFVNAVGGDYHLAPADKGARGHGAPGLGNDIDGEERAGPHYDVGADTVSDKANSRP